jgi:hypothetical protein
MINKRLLSLVKLTGILICFSGISLNADLLTKTAYSNGSKTVLFKNATKGHASCHGPGCHCDVNFSFVIENGSQVRVTKVETPKDGEADNYCPVPLLSQPCTLNIDRSEKIYNNQLVCGEETYINEAASIAKNAQTEINSVPVIYLGDVVGSTTTVVKFRETPDANARAGKCYTDAGAPAETLSKNTRVVVVARTLSKVKVANWENYWYFVRAGDYCAFGEEQKLLPYRGVWVFGEFIKYPGK